jgi:Icc-related predicted phosphoesterase
MAKQEQTPCFFVSDLHGRTERYRKFFKAIASERPRVIFIGGDLLPHGFAPLSNGTEGHRSFTEDFLMVEFSKLRETLGQAYPRIFVILGNDDGRFEEAAILNAQRQGLWEYIHRAKASVEKYSIYGYAFVPPTPFRLKDWERYDVSRYVDPGCLSPEEGWRTVSVPENEKKYYTIQQDLDELANDDCLEQAIFLFHTPPHQTHLDRAALDNKKVEHVPLDVHVGSVAVRRFIESRQPLLTLHGHVHESARLTGFWRDRIGRTHIFTAAHDGPELALVRFSLENPENATRELI